MSNEVEQMMLGGLVHQTEYSNKVYPHLQDVHFEDETFQAIFRVMKSYRDKYNSFPSKEATKIELESLTGLKEGVYQTSSEFLDKLYGDKMADGITKQSLDWLLDRTKRHVLDRSCYVALMKSLSIIDGEDKKTTREAIPEIFKEAISVNFDEEIGHDYLDDAAERFEFYHKKEKRIPFSLGTLNAKMGGGPPLKALVVPVAPTGVGKSLFLTNEAAHWLTQGTNVLYVTLEMAEERIAERIDAKLMDLTIDELRSCPKPVFESKIAKIRNMTAQLGKIVIKEYPPGTFNANHLRFLLTELKQKKNFSPDVICVDYLNLMSSYRIKDASNMYSNIKAIAEELRGVAMERNALVISPTQSNRSAQGASDFDLNEVSESHGISMTADAMFGIISTPELEELGHLRIKGLKNRWGPANFSFIVGVKRAKMSMYDLDEVPDYSPAPVSASVGSAKPKSATGFKW